MAKEDKEKRSQKNPSFWLGLIAVLAALLLILSFLREPISTAPVAGAKFPLVVWLIVVGGVLGLRAFTEIKKPGAPAVTFNMGCVALGFLTLMIIIFEVFHQGWWGNIWGTATGKLLLVGFVVGVLLWYILPGTGKITVQLGKILSAIIVLVTLVMLIGIATQKDFAQGIQGIQEKGALRWSLTETKDFLWKSPPKPAPYVPSYQLIAGEKYTGKGFEQDSEISTDWRTSNILRKNDEINYVFPKDAFIEVINSKGDRVRYKGPKQTLYFSTDVGEVTFWLSRGAKAYVELRGVR